MPLIFLLKGILIGFVMAVPIGPVGIMCIRKTLTKGLLNGFIIGLGAAAADMFFSSVAAFGLTYISQILIDQRILIRAVGGALLLLLGIKIFRSQPKDPKFQNGSSGMFKAFSYSAFVTLTNPFTIFAFIGVFATFGLTKGLTHFYAAFIVAGVFAGSSLWFLLLSSGVTFFRKKFDVNGQKWANKIAGILIFISGIIAIASL